MHSASRMLRAAARSITVHATVLCVTVLPVILFSRLLHAEGPLALLYAWTGLCSSCIFLASTPLSSSSSTIGLKRRLRTVTTVCAAVFSLVAVLVVLAQVNVARRSLAEAWLELARQGRAFGFFSFFTTEIYALFCLAQALLLGARKYLSFVICATVTNLLCAGIILNRPVLLLLTLAGVFLFFLVSTPKQSGVRMSTLIKSVSFPVASGLALAILLALFSIGENRPRQLFKTPDLSALFVRLAPSFPLMRDVPGYGFSAGSADMPDSVYLSQRILFNVQGAPYALHYLADTRYRTWNGRIWTEDPDAGETLPLVIANGTHHGGLRLTLVDDFHSAIPTEQHTTSAALSADAPAKATFTRNKGIRFEPSARRGLVAYLLTDSGLHATVRPDDPQYFTNLAAYTSEGGPASSRLVSLARELRQRSNNSDREYLRLLLDHFSQGYRYSLQTARQNTKADTIDDFVFDGKQGFCLYFASAFVLLAREGGLPARLVEGFRVELDERGLGTISGSNAHAWPEVWIDGEWRIFEPTPPYTADDPFAYLGDDDQSARRQLEDLFGKPDKTTTQRPALKTVLIAAMQFATAAALAATALYFAKRKKGKLRRKAARMVSYYRKRGVSGPEIIGWIKWAEEVNRREIRKKNTADQAAEVAAAMIEAAYGEGRN